MTEYETLSVYVPKEGTELREHIAQGSGIVGSPYGDTGRLRLDYEGNLHGLPELERFADRVARAAERHTWETAEGKGYPTSACAYTDPNQVVKVGEFVPEDGRVKVSDEESLAGWLGYSEVPAGELSATS